MVLGEVQKKWIHILHTETHVHTANITSSTAGNKTCLEAPMLQFHPSYVLY